ncbi:MAG: hypothetical protein AAGU77_14570, partial [Bacillota bacterium]
AGAVTKANSGAAVNIQTPSLTINAGSVGDKGSYVGIDLAAGGALNITSRGDVFVEELFGDMIVGVVSAAGSAVFLTADRSVKAQSAAGAADIIAGSITLISRNGSIGTSNQYLDIDSSAGGEGIVNAQCNGGIYLRETNKDMTAGLMQSGEVCLKSAGGITSGACNQIIAAKLTIEAQFVGAAQKPLQTAIGFINATAAGGSVYISNTGDLVIGSISSPQTVGITASGYLAGNGPSSIAADTFIFEATRVGTVSAPFKTAVRNIQGNAGSGAIFIDNTGALTVVLLQTSAELHLNNSGGIASGNAPVNIVAPRFLFTAGADVGTRQNPLKTNTSYVSGRGSGSAYIS